MMARQFPKFEISTTVQFTWVASAAPNSLYLAILTASETLVNSVAGVQSGGGNWYAFVTIPDSFGKYPCYLKAVWTATMSTHAGNASPFVNPMLFEVDKTKVFPFAGS